MDTFVWLARRSCSHNARPALLLLSAFFQQLNVDVKVSIRTDAAWRIVRD